ncbi:hypothetical protein [Thermococcus peptonophilus]|uniref:Uncharacterized protein n=1 Tax=Thermococcus peptonophilus TaxID=53952 RepID=A0A142CSM6_9EURY|nr:hypothetical protein [Thermococcus peptonophilus]AMQ17778.1 hypothetical protein A0127_00620 [Thermococcus peptonophilus]
MEPIEVIFYIEGLSNDRKALESAMGQTAESLKAEKDVEIRDIYVDEIVEDPDNDLLPYSGMIEARIRGPFEVLVDLAIRYAPAAVDLVSTDSIEIPAKHLTKILGGVSYLMGQLMEKFGPLAAYPKLDELPEPQVGYSREEIESLIIDERMLLYRFVVEVYGEDENRVEADLKKALVYEGCRINKFAIQQQGENEETNRKRFLVAAELISDVETAFQLTGKYAPVAISVVEPEIVDLNPSEIQGVLSDLAGFAHELVTRPLKAMAIEKANTSFKLMR